MRRPLVCCLAFAALAVSAGSDAVAPKHAAAGELTPAGAPDLNRSPDHGLFGRYVAIGISISMGWPSDGVLAATQATSWPSQLGLIAHRIISQPYIAGTGCRSPLKAPLSTFVRWSGERVDVPTELLSCSAPPRRAEEGPVQNLAINAAIARDALLTTSDNTTDSSRTSCSQG